MALIGHPFPYDINNLLVGAVAILYGTPGDGTAGTVDVPADISEVIDMEAPYTALTGWTYLGATKEAFSYNRGFESEGLEIQQSAAQILEEITEITRAINVSQAEFSPFGFQLMENAPNVATIAAAAGKSAQKKIAFGNFSSAERYRFAFLSRRPLASGVVTESAGAGGATRGRFVMGVAYQGQIAADEIEMEQGKGELTASDLTFTLFPETTIAQPEGEEVGTWLLEDAGTIT